jgi:hypothetical protein
VVPLKAIELAMHWERFILSRMRGQFEKGVKLGQNYPILIRKCKALKEVLGLTIRYKGLGLSPR